MTQMCGDKKMLRAYQNGRDLYAEIASLAFNKPYEDCLEKHADGTYYKEGDERRTQAKSILLGILYGRGLASVAEQLHTTKQKAQQIQDKIFKGFPAIPKFEKDSLKMAHDLGYVTTLWGRKRRLPDLQLEEYEFIRNTNSSNDENILDFDEEVEEKPIPEKTIKKYLTKLHGAWGSEKREIFEEANREGIWVVDNGAKIAEAKRQCVNSRIQGSAADMTKLAMILVHNDEKLRKWGFRLLIPVHDELIGECPEENAKKCKKRFSMLMSQAAEEKLDMPITCDVDVFRAWKGEKVEI